MEAMARPSSTEAFNDVLATIVRADEVVAVDAEKDSGPLNTSASSAVPAVTDRDHVTGSSSPKLTIVEYGDFGCPYCVQASRPVKSLMDRFDGLRLVWRHFPVPALHPRADLAAELSELAGLHGKFWDAHSLLLTPGGRFSHDDLLSVAGRLELDPAETHAALGEHTFRERVLADIEGGRRAGVHATPTFFVDGKRLGCRLRELPQIVRASLARA
jgi:protein-disulfide isomerase